MDRAEQQSRCRHHSTHDDHPRRPRSNDDQIILPPPGFSRNVVEQGHSKLVAASRAASSGHQDQPTAEHDGTNHRPHVTFSMDDLRRSDPDLHSAVLRMGERYGYADPDRYGDCLGLRATGRVR
jgi:hypothetical protein